MDGDSKWAWNCFARLRFGPLYWTGQFGYETRFRKIRTNLESFLSVQVHNLCHFELRIVTFSFFLNFYKFKIKPIKFSYWFAEFWRSAPVGYYSRLVQQKNMPGWSDSIQQAYFLDLAHDHPNPRKVVTCRFGEIRTNYRFWQSNSGPNRPVLHLYMQLIFVYVEMDNEDSGKPRIRLLWRYGWCSKSNIHLYLSSRTWPL